jgi:hypothetical protein
MPNAYIPRETVHAWSETIGDAPEAHQTALTRLLKDQRRLTRFIEENAENLQPATAGVSIYLTGVIVRMFDLAGGRLRNATWAQIREAEAKVNAAIEGLLPFDEGFPERARQTHRAQAHILDEALLALFERDKDEEREEEAELDTIETIKVYLVLWVVTEVLDMNWKPAKDFEGMADYEYVHIEKTKKDKDGED